VEKVMLEPSLDLPAGYYLERNPDLMILRHIDGSIVGAFSARGAAPEVIHRIVEEIANPGPWEPGTPRPEAPNPDGGAAMQARFFGHFELLCDGEPVHLGRNGKALAILKYLLANRSRPVSQDHLMGWLWPDSNLKKARWSLNSAIHGLRKLLGRCPSSSSSGSASSGSASGSGGGSVNYIVLEEGYYRLSPAVGVATDVESFDERYERGRRLERMGRADEAARAYEEAVGLYRGDYLLEDLYEDWTMVERERLSNAHVEMLDRLAVYYMERGQLRESVRACYEVLEKDRCHEDSHRLLMSCYVGLGQRGRALRQYRLCERILAQEYGTAPSPEIQDLYRSILGDEGGMRSRGGNGGSGPGAP
jgi:DNA-binding SARP family transcriptional activator